MLYCTATAILEPVSVPCEPGEEHAESHHQQRRSKHLRSLATTESERKRLGLGQAGLAEKIGASRQWVVSIEQGHSRAELGLVLRTLDTLGIRLETRDRDATAKWPSGPDIDAIVAAARKGGP